MLRHSKCLYKDQVIGIEYIISAKDGKQINIPDRTEWLREQGRFGNLFCDCGCGATLILVAGDRQINEDGIKKGKRQHFRIKNPGHRICTSTEESEETLYSKIVLKCWLCDKLFTDNVKMNVPINTVSESDRKYEYTLFNDENQIGVLFWKNRKNISDERIRILEECNNKKVICVVGSGNDNATGQYQEYMVKIQKRQGYCIFLSLPSEIDDLDDTGYYEQATLKASVFCENFEGEWQEIDIAEGNITEFSISKETGYVSYKGAILNSLASDGEVRFFNEQALLQKKKQQEELRRKQLEEERTADLERKKIEKEEQERRRIEAEKVELEREKQKNETAKGRFQACCKELGILEVSLLTKEEAQYIRKSSLSMKKSTWWLSSKGDEKGTVGVIYDNGTISCGDVGFKRGIRPVLRLKQDIEEPYNEGDSFEFAGQWFTAVNSKLALCDDYIGYAMFREDGDAFDATDYMKSDVKKFIENWCIKSFM